MINQEAIEILKNIKAGFETDEWLCDDAEALGKGIEALENQKAMPVELEGDGYSDGELVYDYGKCPKCGWDFEDGDKDWGEPYCCHCGQRLRWFD